MLKLERRARGHFVTLIEIHLHLIRDISGSIYECEPGARWALESSENLYGPFSGVKIPLNFTVMFLLVNMKTLKDRLPNQAVGSSTSGFSGPKSVRDFRETGPWSKS